MTIYYIIFVFLIGFALISSDRTLNTTYSRLYKYCFGFCIFILTVFACVRGPYVGQDTRVYIRIFCQLQDVPWKSIIQYSRLRNLEIGYIVYNKLLSYLSKNGQFVTVGNSIFLMTLVGKVMKKECRNPTCALFVFYTIGMYQSSFNIVSSMIASYIVYCGIDAIRERRFLHFLGYIFTATLFHTASIIFIPLYFLYSLKLNLKRISLVLAAGLLGSVQIYWFFDVLARFIPVKYIRYLERAPDNGLILLFHFLILLVFFGVQLASTGNLKTLNDEEVRVHIWAVLLELAFLSLAMRINIFTRVAFMFMPSMPVFIDRMTNKIPVKNNKVLLYFGLGFMIGLQYIIRLQINNIGGSAPYYFYWNA